tara:strand:- start:1135 stop:1362 length:228 start_codon:yes stop_codon:yes gene_type:complete
MLDQETAKIVAKCIAEINPQLIKGKGAIMTQKGLESLLQLNNQVVSQVVQHIAQHCMLNEAAIKNVKEHFNKEEA